MDLYESSSQLSLSMKNFEIKLQKAENKCIAFCLNFPWRFYINPLHFRKIYWLLASNWVEDYIVNTNCRYWNGIVPRYIYEIFKPSLRRFSTRSQITFFGPKILSKINHNIKNAKTMPSFMHAIKKSTLLHLQTHANLINYHILMINVII